VTGCDGWVIASAQHLSMEQFLVFMPEEERTAAGFRLDRTETTYALALNKRPSRRKNKPCIFLFSLSGGYDRCMVYPHRPLVCQTFPASLHHGSVAIREDTVCPKGIWNVAAMDLPEWRLCLLRMEMESAIYHLIVSQWNECVEKGPSDASYSIIQYFSYLMNAYNRLERLRNSIPEEEMAAIVRRWGQQAVAPPKGSPSKEVGRDEDEMPWQRFLTRVQEELAEFATMLPKEAA